MAPKGIKASKAFQRKSKAKIIDWVPRKGSRGTRHIPVEVSTSTNLPMPRRDAGGRDIDNHEAILHETDPPSMDVDETFWIEEPVIPEQKRSQMDFDNEDHQVGSQNEYDTATDLGFRNSKPDHRDKEGNPIITVVDRSGIHEIGVSWCCCPEAPEHEMQLMMAGLFPATFRNPRQCLPSGY
ncbi:hypothetical protein EDB85DRAFT_1899444 [Lactarius pseudohatsudake]|nr:hypothetical protein EDB85DRAFT_1899444 [Lactarius pseudohatsudake]